MLVSLVNLIIARIIIFSLLGFVYLKLFSFFFLLFFMLSFIHSRPGAEAMPFYMALRPSLIKSTS